MSVRRTITLLTVPLFLALALVNGAMLYFQERAEISQAMAEQALTAAVTGAEFISTLEDPHTHMADPPRVEALKLAARHIHGLDGIYLVAPGAAPHALVEPVRPWVLRGLARPSAAQTLPIAADASDHRYVVALAPANGGAFVAARIDAEPMFARISAIKGTVLLIVLVAGLTATALSAFVAKRITRELERNSQAIAAIAAGHAPKAAYDLRIRETRDLASAVRLMEASSKAAAERARRVMRRGDSERTLASAMAASRATLFEMIITTAAGAQVAMRICGDAPMGSFFALRSDGKAGLLAIGKCQGETPQAALAAAAGAQRFLQEAMPDATAADLIAALRDGHAVETLEFQEWRADTVPGETELLTLAGPADLDRAKRYADHNRDAAPAELLDGIAMLTQPVGVFAAFAGLR
jgi:hypothetical protein